MENPVLSPTFRGSLAVHFRHLPCFHELLSTSKSSGSFLNFFSNLKIAGFSGGLKTKVVVLMPDCGSLGYGPIMKSSNVKRKKEIRRHRQEVMQIA